MEGLLIFKRSVQCAIHFQSAVPSLDCRDVASEDFLTCTGDSFPLLHMQKKKKPVLKDKKLHYIHNSIVCSITKFRLCGAAIVQFGMSRLLL